MVVALVVVVGGVVALVVVVKGVVALVVVDKRVVLEVRETKVVWDLVVVGVVACD